MGEGLAFAEAGRHRPRVHGAAVLVFGPGGAAEVAAHDGFEGEDGEAAHLHGAVLEHGAGLGGDGGGEGEGEEVGFEGGEGGGEDGEPVGGQESEEDAFVWDALLGGKGG